MNEKLYRSEPIPHRSQQASADQTDRKRPAPRTPMNGSRPDARQAIARILADERFQGTARSTAKRAASPADTDDAARRLSESLDRISDAIKTAQKSSTTVKTAANKAHDENLFSPAANRPSFDLPDRYHQMRAISRWQEGTGDKPGRWLSEAELFYRQGTLMADWEDSCPYNGLFKSYFPTYNAMSDRQLRGYFTWRAAVRAGDIQETSLSFAYVYLYELVNGIGVNGPLDGFRKIESFWQAYRVFAPELDRYVNVWLQDYAVYHRLDPLLLAPYKTVAFDRALIALRDADAEMGTKATGMGVRRKRGESAISLPPDTAREERLFIAIDALSTYRLSNSRLYQQEPDALRHVACAVYMRMSEHYRKQRKNSLLESWFGEEVELPYTMFGSAVFFEPERHADASYELDEIHRYRCERGLWTCERFHGSRARSPKLGAAMRAVDRSLRLTLDPEHPLKDDEKTPKYLQKFIDQEVETWNAWAAAHAPVRIDIDLSRLAGIRSAAAETREALLIDEEREDEGTAVASDDVPAPVETVADGDASSSAEVTAPDAPRLAAASAQQNAMKYTFAEFSDPLKRINLATLSNGLPNEAGEEPEGSGQGGRDTRAHPETITCPSLSASETPSPLSPAKATYLQALANGNRAQAAAATQASGMSEDLLVDAINEVLFDQVGDTVIEYGPDGTPQLIEDYREDIEGILNHE